MAKDKTKKYRSKGRRPVIEEVEARILYSADFAPATLADPLLSAGLPADVRVLETPAVVSESAEVHDAPVLNTLGSH